MFNIKLEGFDKLSGDLDDMVNNMPAETSNLLDKAASMIEDKMKSESPVATGILKDSINVISPSENVRVIGPGVDYAYYQHNRDSRPQRSPPREKILEWARVKGFGSNWGGTEDQAAFLIARKIALRGYRAQPFVRDTFNWFETQIGSLLAPFLRATLRGAA